MNRERYQLIRQLFLQVRDLTRAAREAHLAQACSGDPELYREVEGLLVEQDETEDLLLSDTVPLTEPGATGPVQLGRYHLIRELGRGGMGVVYEAEQDEPRRRVALNLLKPGRFGRDALRRFRLEAEVLGRLQHPGIATVHEAGIVSTPQGPQPFFAMELIRGQPLQEYLTAKQPDLQSRIRLTRRICDAVQHAHQHGVIHRDLKPANILVTDAGLPKILDFGVARVTAPDLIYTSPNTEIGAIIGTLQYMSPEQAAGDPARIDTRTDVYALGMILYQLMTETVPYDISRAGLVEALRVIRDQPPARPGTIARPLRGDLETIMLKALAKEPERRYQTAAALGDDLQRYLEQRPIEAHPPSVSYHLAKLARRHRGLFAGMVSTLLALVLGLVLTAQYAAREKEQAEAASQALEVLQGVLTGTDPYHGGDREPTVRELLDRSITSISTDLEQRQPAAVARVLTVLGCVYYHWGRLEESEGCHRRALKLSQEVYGQEHETTVEAMNNLAAALRGAGRLDEAEDLHLRALPLRIRIHGANHLKTLTTRNNLGAVYLRQGRFADAEREFRAAADGLAETRGPADEFTLGSVSWLAFALSKQGKNAEAAQLQRAAIDSLSLHGGGNSPTMISLLSTHSQTLRNLRRWSEAEAVLRELVALLKKTSTLEHPEYSKSVRALAAVLKEQDREAEAEEVLRALPKP